MNYTFIIFLIILIGVIILIAKEFNEIKLHLNDKITTVLLCMDNSSKSIKNSVKNDFNVCLDKIKDINNDCIKQVRKMAEFGSQPITNMSNHYTDTDSMALGIKNGQ